MKLDNGWISVDDEHLLPKIGEQCQVLIKGPAGRISVAVGGRRTLEWFVPGHTGCTILAHQPLSLAAPPTVPAPSLMQELGERYFTRLDRLDEYIDRGGVFHPESFLAADLLAAGITIKKTRAVFVTLRPDGTTDEPIWCPDAGDEY